MVCQTVIGPDAIDLSIRVSVNTCSKAPTICPATTDGRYICSICQRKLRAAGPDRHSALKFQNQRASRRIIFRAGAMVSPGTKIVVRYAR